MPGNEAAAFPVTSADADVGTTMRLYYFQGANVAAAGVDESVNGADLEEGDTPPATYGSNGYGQEVKSDGQDEAVTTTTNSGTAEMFQDTANNTTHTNTTAMTIEIITRIPTVGGSVWSAISALDAAIPTAGWEIFYCRSNECRFIIYDSSGNTLRADVDISAGFTANDWYYLCCIWDSTQATDTDKVNIYAGNLTSTTANLVAKSNTNDGGASSMAAANNLLYVLGSLRTTGQCSGTYLSTLRIQDKAFSAAVAEARYDEIKTWAAGSGSVPAYFHHYNHNIRRIH